MGTYTFVQSVCINIIDSLGRIEPKLPRTAVWHKPLCFDHREQEFVSSWEKGGSKELLGHTQYIQFGIVGWNLRHLMLIQS